MLVSPIYLEGDPTLQVGVRNVTDENHILHRGQVSRIIYRSADGTAYQILTAGPGSGPLGAANVLFSEWVWQPVDQRVIQTYRREMLP